MGWRNAPRGKWKGRHNGQGEALLSCRRDGSPVAVIVMRAWLAVAGVPPAAFASKRIHACRVLHPAAFPADNGSEKRKNDKTVSAVQHKHIKEVPTTMAVSLVTLWSSWAFLCLCRF